ncbi:hypothetical protein [Rhizobium sp. AN69]|uniref:hypothetical protein n=1 Tax=Rhizobium sp. AN69 TaxID=3035213 RepID=UPI002B25DB4A|nr:hypothetical protein [Rhizobium sp. AN69]
MGQSDLGQGFVLDNPDFTIPEEARLLAEISNSLVYSAVFDRNGRFAIEWVTGNVGTHGRLLPLDDFDAADALPNKPSRLPRILLGCIAVKPPNCGFAICWMTELSVS